MVPKSKKNTSDEENNPDSLDETDQDEENKEKKSKKYDRKHETLEELEKRFVKSKPTPSICCFRGQIKFSPVVRSKTIGECYICGKPAEYKAGFKPKGNDNKEEILGRYVCTQHRFSLISCQCASLPFYYAICNYLRTENWCPCFDVEENNSSNPIKPQIHSNEKCQYEKKAEVNPLPISTILKCDICGNRASWTTPSNQPLKPERCFCESHKPLLFCSKKEIACESALCQYLTQKSDCIFFT